MVVKVLDEVGKKIFEQRYAFPSENSYTDRMRVVAKTVAAAEKEEDRKSWEDKFYDVLSTGDLIPGGRIIYGSGRQKQNLLNCYMIEPLDSIESIGTTIKDMYQISCGGGGVGFNFSKIRPKGDPIGNVKNSAPGSISVMKMINEISNHVKAGKNRRSALMAELNVTHPDIIEFLHVKLDLAQLTNFNISVAVNNKFIEACENDEEWYFTFGNKKYYVYQMDRISPDGKVESMNVVGESEVDATERALFHLVSHPDDRFENVIKYPLKAKELWDKIWYNAVKSGEPGIFNISLANSYTNLHYFLPEMNQTNPCSEIIGESYANCCLSHINLANMASENGEVDYKRIAKAVRRGIRFLDNVLTVNWYPLAECKVSAERSRRIGLGTTGLHHLLIKLGIEYGSEKCLEFLDRLYETIRNEAYLTSMYIAREKGSFQEFNARKFLAEDFARTLPARVRMLIKENGIRNGVMLTCAPCGTISFMHGISASCEPIFAPMFKRRYRENSAWREVIVLDPIFKKCLEEGKDYKHIKGAYDIPPEKHMAVQAVVQRYIDNAVSKTINIPESSTHKEISEYALKYIPYLKGLTVYRKGSRGMEPLEEIPTTEENIQKYAMPIIRKEKEGEESVETGSVCKLNGECGG